MIEAMESILIWLWTASIALLAGAYKLEHDKSLLNRGEDP